MSVYKFQPFSLTKEVGLEYDRHCRGVESDSDWILILDWDCMLLTPKAYQVIENAVTNYPETLIFGAMTNRVGLKHHRILPDQDDNDSIRHHIGIAEGLAAQYPNGEYHTANQCAGFFMLFRKSYWVKNNFQEKVMNQTGNLFDYTFSRPAGKIEGGIKILDGVYVFHQYRITKDWHDKSHLRG